MTDIVSYNFDSVNELKTWLQEHPGVVLQYYSEDWKSWLMDVGIGYSLRQGWITYRQELPSYIWKGKFPEIKFISGEWRVAKWSPVKPSYQSQFGPAPVACRIDAKEVPPLEKCAVGPFKEGDWDTVKKVWDVFAGAGYEKNITFNDRSQYVDEGYVWAGAEAGLSRWTDGSLYRHQKGVIDITPEDFLAAYAIPTQVPDLCQDSTPSPQSLDHGQSSSQFMNREQAHELQGTDFLEWVRSNRDQVGLKAPWQTKEEAEQQLIAEVRKGKE